MNTERLTRLAALLRAPLPPRTTFDIGNWSQEAPCGTVCCAAGLAMLDPWFQEQGLGTAAVPNSTLSRPRVGDLFDFSAMAVLLGISTPTAMHLFSATSYDRSDGHRPQPEDVAARIMALVNGGPGGLARQMNRYFDADRGAP